MMKTISLDIIDSAGEKSKLKLSINESIQQGLLEWPVETSNLIKLRLTNKYDRIQCWVKWSSFKLRCVISINQSKGNSYLYVYLASRRYAYTISQIDFTLFSDFIKNLSLPIEEKIDNSPERERNVTEFDNDLDKVKLDFSHLSLFIAWRPSSSIQIDFNEIIIDGVMIRNLQSRALPADQGFYIPLGFFKNNTNLFVLWEFETRYLRQPAEILLGVFRNHSLTNRTTLKRIKLDMFETYTDSSIVIV